MKPSPFKNICWGNLVFFIVVIFLFIMSLLNACGTKGDLYIPDKQQPSTPLSSSNKTTDTE